MKFNLVSYIFELLHIKKNKTMAKQIDQLKKEKYKISRLLGKSGKQSLLDAGYTENTAKHSSTIGPNALSVVKCSEAELKADVLADKRSIIEKIETIINLKLDVEQKALLLAKDSGDLEIFWKMLSKSKDNITELTKLKELLSGKPTEKVELTSIPDGASSDILTDLALRRKRF